MRKTVLWIIVAFSIIGFVTILLNRNPATPGNEARPLADRVQVRVVSEGPGAPPIAGARIVGQLPSGPVQGKTDARGLAFLPRGEATQLRILAPNHVGVLVEVDLSKSEQTVVLKRTGSARLQALDPAGKPVEGVAFHLSAPNPDPSAILLGQEPQKYTDGQGIVRWVDLPPGVKAEWSVTSGHTLDSGEKGTLAIAGGEESAASVRVQPSTSVRLHLTPGRYAGGTARIEIVADRSIERAIEVAINAPVSIPHLKPGHKRVRAAWWDAPLQRAYATSSFSIADREIRDLGLLPSRSGESVEVRVAIDAAPEFAKAIIKPAMVRLRITTEAGYEDPPLVDDVVVEAGRVYTLKGVPAARMTISCVPDFKFEPGTPLPKIEPIPLVEVSIPTRRIEISIKIS